MEPEHNEDHTPDRPDAGHSEPSAEQATLPAPFVSEGLERLRDSHC